MLERASCGEGLISFNGHLSGAEEKLGDAAGDAIAAVDDGVG
jgi:hypothetical protein